MRRFLLLVALLSSTESIGQSSADTPLPFAGPSDLIASSNVPVTGVASVGDVNVVVDVTFPNTRGVGVTLRSPAGTSVILFQDACDGFADIRVVFDDEAAQPIGAVCPAVGGGSFQPFEPLSAFDGEAGNGTWILEVGNFSSVTAGLNGTLNQWTNNVTPAGTPPPPAAQVVPSLSQWGALLLMLLLLGLGVQYSKSQR